MHDSLCQMWIADCAWHNSHLCWISLIFFSLNWQVYLLKTHYTGLFWLLFTTCCSFQLSFVSSSIALHVCRFACLNKWMPTFCFNSMCIILRLKMILFLPSIHSFQCTWERLVSCLLSKIRWRIVINFIRSLMPQCASMQAYCHGHSSGHHSTHWIESQRSARRDRTDTDSPPEMCTF